MVTRSLSAAHSWGRAAFWIIATIASFPPFGFWWLAFVAPVGWMLIAASPHLSRTSWLALSVCAWLMWMWFEFWMVDVALIGYPVACLYLALYAPLTVWMLRTASRGTLGCKLPWAVLAPIVVGTCE